MGGGKTEGFDGSDEEEEVESSEGRDGGGGEVEDTFRSRGGEMEVPSSGGEKEAEFEGREGELSSRGGEREEEEMRLLCEERDGWLVSGDGEELTAVL